jgi:hypothetical protein
MPVVYLEKSDVGATLPTWLWCTLWMLYAAKGEGKTPYVHWPNHPHRCLVPFRDQEAFARQPNMFDWWFRQPCWDLQQGLPPRDETWEWEHCPHTGTHNIFAQPFADLKAFYQQHLLFQPEVESRIADLVAKYQIDQPNTIGVSWRGCDAVDDGRPRIPIEEYFPVLDGILDREPGLRIVATAEEHAVTDQIVARSPNTITIPEWFSAPPGYPKHSDYLNPASGYEKGIQVCGMIFVLSRCRHYVRNWSSQSCIVNFLSTGTVHHIRCTDLNRGC